MINSSTKTSIRFGINSSAKTAVRFGGYTPRRNFSVRGKYYTLPVNVEPIVTPLPTPAQDPFKVEITF